MTAAVSLRDVSVRFGKRWALARVSVDIPASSTVLVTGENGAGKTTLLRTMATALRPTRGTVAVLGVSTAKALEPARSRLTLLTHQSHLYEDLTALENLRLLAQLTGRNGADLDGALQRVGLGDHTQQRVRTFSAGMKRRLAIAKLVVRQPQLALLDEPFGRLDPQGVAMVEEIITELGTLGTTIVVSTHDIDRGKRLCDRHLRLSAGRTTGELEPC